MPSGGFARLKRLIEQTLLDWKQAPRRKPLLLRGARQVGKTWSVNRFGREQFDDFVNVDLERDRHLHRIFAGSLETRGLLSDLELVAGRRIKPGRTLVFLDEIQTCPRAVMALRYFYEELPELHVVAAGSLLEFGLGEIAFPVGRVQSAELHPLCFLEFLWALGQERASALIQEPPGPVSATSHSLLLDHVRDYCFVGGMPESVAAFSKEGSVQASFEIQRELINDYRQDFGKYAPRADPGGLDAVLRGAARRVGHQIKYTHLAEGPSVPTLKRSFDTLCKARVISRVRATSPAGLPLAASASAKRFKALLVDVGLWQALSGVRASDAYAEADLLGIHRGAMAEHFVGQELRIAQGEALFYWARSARGSSAEVDYLAVVGDRVVPIEVKSGAAGRLRSLHLLLKSYPNCPEGLVFSSRPYAELPEQKLRFIPLYFAYSATRTEN